ncbi:MULTISPECIES: DNA primase [Segatella]|uniref:DNA primase n=3 Tax=Segatella TaxID=2974251 RepID=D8DYC3_9BACT|nr:MULTISPECIES: DNA primase [Segatella]EFI71548.1 putative DNA primase [Segatella baroniae B14]OYP56430.1 DNA primase [Segatella bryantii]UKK73019.1 DNA primase [Segatella bryantii]UKK75817.1 DNA primase [Segatella bryantii]UKK77418.1 DNA primase [Segatella baroniae B14]
MIDRSTVQKIMDATNIVEVVSEFVSLRKSGANYKGLCPFHDDTTPSFYVSPARGICHCFTCGKGGNAVNFLMEHEQMTYPESLRWLARKYHIEIQERELSEEEKRQENERESMFIVNEWAAKYFQNILHHDVDGLAVGMQYFRSRGFRDDIIQKFQLGFDLPERNKLPETAIQEGYQREFLIKTGLCYERDHGELVDRFAGRAMFPWIGVSGKVVAFGGRVLDSRTKGVNQKYVNSPDSEIYHKERELYGIYQAKRAIAKEDRVYMVEGYTDVISMHQSGIENVVANSGTALSKYQIHLLHRFTSNIVLLYDGDAAGIHAALRGTDMLLAEGMNVKVLLLPDGNDPDSFARSHTAEEFRQYVEEHQMDFIEFKTDVLLKGVTDPIKRSEAINSIVFSVSVITDQIIRATYIHDCSVRLGIAEATLISTMNRFIREGQDEKIKEEQRQINQQSQETVELHSAETQKTAMDTVLGFNQSTSSQASHVETMLVQMLVRYGDRVITIIAPDRSEISLPLAQYVGLDLGSDQLRFHDDRYNQILNEALQHVGEENFKSESYFLQHPDLKISGLAAKLCVDKVQISKSLKPEPTEEQIRNNVLRLVLNFRCEFMENRLKNLKNQINQLSISDPDDKLLEVMKEYKEVQDIRNVLAKKLGNEIIQ